MFKSKKVTMQRIASYSKVEPHKLNLTIQQNTANVMDDDGKQTHQCLSAKRSP